jgi:ankyrin repeat protein
MMRVMAVILLACLATGCTRNIVTKYEDIYEAAKAGDYEDVRRFLKKHAPIETKRDMGKTALHAAAMNGDTAIIAILLRAGANIEAEDDLNNRPLDYAVHDQKAAAAGHLLRAGAQFERRGGGGLVFDAIENNDWQTLPVLLDWEPRSRDTSYLTNCLEYAVMHDAESIIGTLARRGADVNYRDSRGETLLHTAAELDNWRTVWELCYLDTEKVNLDAQDNDGCTPLHLAAKRNHEDAVRWLLLKGANPSIKDKRHRTPLDWAKAYDYTDVISEFRKQESK